jgi:hypothetical protein
MIDDDIPELTFAHAEAAAVLEDAGLADATDRERAKTVERAKEYVRDGLWPWPRALHEAAEYQAMLRNGPRASPLRRADPQLKLPLNEPGSRAA